MAGPLKQKAVPLTSSPPSSNRPPAPISVPRQSQDYNFAGPSAARVSVCYCFDSGPPLILPAGVQAFSFRNYDEYDRPRDKPIVSAQAWNADGDVDGAVLNYEPERRRIGDGAEVLQRWTLLLRRSWPRGRCVAYGADMAVNNPEWLTSVHTIAMALRKPRAADERGPTQWASLGLDGYKRPTDQFMPHFKERLAWKANRLETFYGFTKTRGTWFIDVQDQWLRDDRSEACAYSKPKIHNDEWILGQIEACPPTADICIFAGADNPDARAIVDAAILKTIGFIKNIKGIP